jgi:hypothetical protein
MIDITYLRSILSYSKNTGRWQWRKRAVISDSRRITRGTNTRCAGKEAGAINATSGYRIIWIDGQGYCSHVLAWAYVTGVWPKYQVDHRNLVRSDDRWCNLRAATRSQNNSNCSVRRHSKSQIKGVRRLPSGRWGASIRVNKRMVYLGTFNTDREASFSFQKAARNLHGDFARNDAN